VIATSFVCIGTSSVESEYEAEYNRWYDEEHIPNLLRVPGYRDARRYRAIQGEPPYMALYALDTPAAYHSAEHDEAVNTPWRERLRPHYRAQGAVYRQLSPAGGLLPGAAGLDAPERGLLVVRLDVAPEHAEEFEEWYAAEHLPALCGVTGVIGGRTFVAVEGTPRYMAMYHLADPAAQASPAWERAAATPWTLRMRRLIPNRWRVVYRPI
jgi:hypothetical protein